MRIPSSFRLLAHTIKVKRLPPSKWKQADCVAFYSEEHHLIALRDTGGTSLGHAFAHELVHACLSAMGHPLNNDEAFVDNLAGLLHQALETSKYPEPKKKRS